MKYIKFKQFLKEKFDSDAEHIDQEKRPDVHLGDLDGMSDDAKVFKKIKFSDFELIIKVDKNKDVYGVVDSQEVGFIMKMDNGTEASVVKEYQKKGIGTELAKIFHPLNPKAKSGGMTDLGKKLYNKVK